MENPDILYQPGAQGGSTLTTQMKPLGMPGAGPTGPMHFDTTWLQRLAERKAMQEERDRNEAKRRVLREEAIQDRMLRDARYKSDAVQPTRKLEDRDNPDLEPIWRYSGLGFNGQSAGGEAPVGAERAAFTGHYRRRTTTPGGAGSVNPQAPDDEKYKMPEPPTNIRKEADGSYTRTPVYPGSSPWSLG